MKVDRVKIYCPEKHSIRITCCTSADAAVPLSSEGSERCVLERVRRDEAVPHSAVISSILKRLGGCTRFPSASAVGFRSRV